MSLPLKTGFPDGLTLSPGYIVRFRATDPTTGADVAGVVVSNVSIFGDTDDPGAFAPTGPFMFVPGPSEA